jgi:hypothetical protein
MPHGAVIFGDTVIGRARNCNHTNMNTFQNGDRNTLNFLKITVTLNFVLQVETSNLQQKNNRHKPRMINTFRHLVCTISHEEEKDIT